MIIKISIRSPFASVFIEKTVLFLNLVINYIKIYSPIIGDKNIPLLLRATEELKRRVDLIESEFYY